jgi:hypothetical protein
VIVGACPGSTTITGADVDVGGTEAAPGFAAAAEGSDGTGVTTEVDGLVVDELLVEADAAVLEAAVGPVEFARDAVDEPQPVAVTTAAAKTA